MLSQMAKVRKKRRPVHQPWVRPKVLKRVFTTRADAALVTADMPCALCGKPREQHHQSREGSDLNCPVLPSIRLKKPWRTSFCPFCGRKAFYNDVELQIAHEVPQCEPFLAMCAALCSSEGNAKPAGKVEFMVVES